MPKQKSYTTLTPTEIAAERLARVNESRLNPNQMADFIEQISFEETIFDIEPEFLLGSIVACAIMNPAAPGIPALQDSFSMAYKQLAKRDHRKAIEAISVLSSPIKGYGSQFDFPLRKNGFTFQPLETECSRR